MTRKSMKQLLLEITEYTGRTYMLKNGKLYVDRGIDEGFVLITGLAIRTRIEVIAREHGISVFKE